MRCLTREREVGAWLYEVKLDGCRVIGIKRGGQVELRSRNNKYLTGTYPGVVAAISRLRAATAVVDGEIVAVDDAGHPSFQALQHRSAHPKHHIVCCAFDLLHLDGEDLVGMPLAERRAKLPAVVKDSGVLLSEELSGSASNVIQAVRQLGLEGVIAKRRDSRYQPGARSDSWVKLKLDRQQEFVVGGYRRVLGASMRCSWAITKDGCSVSLKRSGWAGLAPHLRAMLFDRLKPLHVDRCPFADLPNSKSSHWGAGVTAEEMREMTWVRPKLVLPIRFVEWTAEGHLGHAAFVGVREDKKASDVRKEA